MKNLWPDGRPKVWFELYNEKCDLDATETLAQAVNKALTWVKKYKDVNVENLAIYEVHSQGGWNSPKQDKIAKVYKVIGKKAVQRRFVKGW